MVGLQHYLILGAALFCIGLYGALARRNAVTVLMAIELMLNGVNVTFAALNRYLPLPADTSLFAGQLFVLFVITVAAAEAALGLAIIIAVYRLRRTVQVDQIDLLRG
ncbi:MAG TPA: NADH-quinone oxidoreductase subunit NuoK [Chloroflexota bacterium]|jgi:NADH:ubiquinone oxidoreductase subunit K|nr:NADH-quinone oxidoreductase subunit NuoK [Chloroflexota bacterium]